MFSGNNRLTVHYQQKPNKVGKSNKDAENGFDTSDLKVCPNDSHHNIPTKFNFSIGSEKLMIND